MVLTEEFEKLIHLIAQAFARTHGAEDAAPFADTVLEHAKALAADMTPADPAASAAGVLTPATEVEPAATDEALPPVIQ